MSSVDDTTQPVADDEGDNAAGSSEGSHVGSHVTDNAGGETSFSGTTSDWSGEEEEEEEEEGWLTYTSLPLIGLAGHHVMLLRAFRRFLVVGTNQGAIALLAPRSGRVTRVYHNHTDPIADCACDVAERYLASCDKAGTVVVQSLTEPTQRWRRESEGPVQSVSLHPLYHRLDDRPLLYATRDAVVLTTKTVLWHSRRETVLADDLGRVLQLRWGRNASLVAWLSERGLTLYSYRDRCVVRTVAPPLPLAQLRHYPSTLMWDGATRLLCGWGQWMQSFEVSPGRTAATVTMASDGAAVVPYAVCGLAPYGSEHLLLLTSSATTAGHVEVRVVERATRTERYRGQLTLLHTHPLQLGLSFCDEAASSTTTTRSQSDAHTSAEASYYIVSGDRVVRAVPCDGDDHVDFLLHHQRLDEAYAYATRHAASLRRHTLRELARQLVEVYATGDAAAELVPRLPHLLGTDYAAWEQCIYRYHQRGEAWRLATVLPVVQDAPLPTIDGENYPTASLSLCVGKEYYDLVLLHCLEHDPHLFAAAVHRYAKLCNASVLCHAAAQRYHACCRAELQAQPAPDTEQVEARRALGEAYGTLLRLCGEPGEALRVFLHVRSPAHVFELVRGEALDAQVLQLLPELFRCDAEQTVRLLLEHATRGAASGDVLAPEAVLRRLEGCDRGELLSYLKALGETDAAALASLAARHAQLMATLYIEHDRRGLLPFLRSTVRQLENVREVLALCKKYELHEAEVFLLSHMDRHDEALRVLVQEMHQMHAAVHFVAAQPTRELQASLFRALVQLALEHHASLPVGDAGRYVVHHTQPEDTYATIAARYDVDEDVLRAANATSTAPPPLCVVPLHLLSALLKAAADSAFAELAGVDVSYLLRRLPADEAIPHAAQCIAAATRSRAAEKAFMATILHVAESDLARCYGDMLRGRTAAVRLDMTGGGVQAAGRCARCGRWTRDGTALMAFACGHVFHASCVLTSLACDGLLRVPREKVTDVRAFLQHPERFCQDAADGAPLPRCLVCARKPLAHLAATDT